jgi:hypothetical protein
MLKSITLGILCATGVSAGAHAAPMSASTPQTTTMVTNVASHCWWRNGRQHCSSGRSYG